MVRKILIIIALFAAFATAQGQVNYDLLEKIDFNDTTLVDSDYLKTALSEYIDAAQNPGADAQKQMFDYILAVDAVLQRCTDFEMYKSVYQYFIYGFSALGANMLVDYMMSLPYLERVKATNAQIDEIIKLAGSFERVKIGQEAPDIQAVTIENNDFSLYGIENEYVIILFWSSTCPHCRDLLVELSDFAKKHKNCTVVTVTVSKDFKQVRKLLKKSGLKKGFNICDGEGWNSKIIQDYAVDTTPSLFLLDKDKVIVAKPFDYEELVNSIGL